MGSPELSGGSGDPFLASSNPAREAGLELSNLGGRGVEGAEPTTYVCGANGLQSMVPADANCRGGMECGGCLGWRFLDREGERENEKVYEKVTEM